MFPVGTRFFANAQQGSTHGKHVGRAADCTAAFPSHPAKMLPARAYANADAYAGRLHADADARATVVIPAAFDVALARGIIVTVAVVPLDHYPLTTAGA